MCASSYFSKGDSILFFSWKGRVLLDLYFFRALSKKNKKTQTSLDDNPRRKYEEAEEETKVAEEQSRAKTPTLFE